MHTSAYDTGRMLFENYWTDQFKSILDIGALNVNGSLRDIAPAGAKYVGIDLENGNGVDLVLDDPYSYPFDDQSFDMIVSTSCFEHDPMFWLTFLEASRVLAEGGIFYVNAPSNGWYHTHPWDNWRFYPDATLALEMWAKRNNLDIHLLESFTNGRCEPWNDYVMIFRKGKFQPKDNQFISEKIQNAMNIRRANNPAEIVNLKKNNTDVVSSETLQKMVLELQREIERLQAM